MTLDKEVQGRQDAELAAAEADDEPAVPAEDPTPLPTAQAVTPAGLFIHNFQAIYAAFHAAATAKGGSIKASAAAVLLPEAAKYAHSLTMYQAQMIVAQQAQQGGNE